MLLERLIFGCGRLTGGATEREALRLVQICLDSGIRQFDTAPSYGIGTAEAVIGKALRRAPADVQITAKVGSEPDRWAVAKTWARRVKRTLRSAASADRADFVPVPPRAGPPNPRFAPAAMRQSLARSHDLLGRIDWLLLHEASLADAVPDTIGALDNLATQTGAAAGFSTGSFLTPELAAGFPADWLSQTAIPPAWLLAAPPDGATGASAVHSIVLTGQYLMRAIPGFAPMVSEAAAMIGPGRPGSREVAALFALAAAHAPAARLVIASANPARLEETLGLLGRLSAAQLDALATLPAPMGGIKALSNLSYI